jgi:hypothetical protein
MPHSRISVGRAFTKMESITHHFILYIHIVTYAGFRD